MRGIIRKAISDLRTHPLQTALLFLVVAAASATLSLGLNVQASAARPYDRLRSESNGADTWIYSASPQADFEALARLPSVEAVSGPFPVSWTNYGLRGSDKKQQIALVGMPAELPAFDHPVVTDGRWLNPGAAGEIVVDRGAAKLLKYRVGQKVDLLTPDGPQPFTIVGFAVPTGRAPAPIDDPAFAYVLPETLHRLEPNAVFGADMDHPLRAGLRLSTGELTPELFAQMRAIKFGTFQGRDWTDVRSSIKESNQFDVIFLNVFSIFALLASGLILANSVGGQVLSQVRDIGILKAIGFTPRQVALTLLTQNVGLGLLAGITGIAAGLLVTPFFLERTANILAVPASPSLNAMPLAITLMVVVGIVGVFTLVPAWRAGRIAPIEALQAGAEHGGLRRSRLAGLAARLGLPRVAVVGLKDLSRRPTRTFMTIAALVLAVVTATFSLGIESTFKATMSDSSVIGGPPFDISADRDLQPDAVARQIFESHPEITSYLVRASGGGRIGNQGFDVRGYDGDLNNPRWAVREGRMPVKSGEAAVSTKLAADFGLKVGDSVPIVLMGAPPNPGTPMTLTIVGRYVDLDGRVLTVTRDTLPPGAEITDYLIKTKAGTDNRALADALVRESGGNLDPEVISETVAGLRNQWRPVIFGLDGVLVTIAGVNLLASLLLTIRERRRDFAVLKTIGFTPGQITASVFSGSILLAVAALVIGLPLGLIATRGMFDLLAGAAGISGRVGRMPGIVWLAPLVPGALAVAALGTIIPARRAASVQIAEALRYE